MPVPALSTPTADLALTWQADPAGSGALQVDLALTPANDLALVVGINRLIQDVLRWLYTPPGANPFDPTYGCPLWEVLGQPWAADLGFYEAIIQQGQETFLAQQALAAAQGQITPDAMVDHFTAVSVRQDTTGLALVVNLLVVAQSGASAPIQAVLG